jgi:transglutaminase-like putative cysteine protease
MIDVARWGRVLWAMALGALFVPGLALPASAEGEADPGTRTQKFHVTYVINADGSSAATYETEVKILKVQSVDTARQTQLGYSTSVQQAEVLEAYTRKPDGRRIDAPQSNYQLDINKGREGSAPAFSDRTVLTVILPEVAVGDVTVFKYKVTNLEPVFPGQFSVDARFSKSVAFDDMVIRIDAPAALWTQHAVTEMTESVNEVRGGRKIIEWTWKNPVAIKSNRRDYSAFNLEKQPGYSFSTFRSYEDLAKAYGARARPKAVAGERVRALVEEITRGKSDPVDQARALYEWVATHIDFAGNLVGVGAVVPRDQAFVLDNRMGDCKDHATLLQAMLSVKGIESSQALLNAGPAYHLPAVPVLATVNHVILYVTSQHLFLDTTSPDIPFGMLPQGDTDKPVLLVDGYREGMRTPPLLGESNRQLVKTEVTIKPDGSIAGSVQVSSKGAMAIAARGRLRDLSKLDREEALRQIYRREKKTGFGRLESDDPKPLLDSFNYRVVFESEDFTPIPGPGAFTIHPLYPTEAPIQVIGALAQDEPEADETACFGGHVTEEYVLHLPEGVKVLALPKGIEASSSTVTYKSTYALEGGTLTVKREFDDRNDRNICPIAFQHEYAKLARTIMGDLRAQVVYQ